MDGMILQDQGVNEIHSGLMFSLSNVFSNASLAMPENGDICFLQEVLLLYVHFKSLTRLKGQRSVLLA